MRLGSSSSSLSSVMEEKYILTLDIGTTTIRSFIYNSRAETVGKAFDQVFIEMGYLIMLYKIIRHRPRPVERSNSPRELKEYCFLYILTLILYTKILFLKKFNTYFQNTMLFSSFILILAVL